MTEDEAKTKWCFQLPRMDLEMGTCCVGSQCMAWRTTTMVEPMTGGEIGSPVGHTFSLVGYCGLAGRPA